MIPISLKQGEVVPVADDTKKQVRGCCATTLFSRDARFRTAAGNVWTSKTTDSHTLGKLYKLKLSDQVYSLPLVTPNFLRDF